MWYMKQKTLEMNILHRLVNESKKIRGQQYKHDYY